MKDIKEDAKERQAREEAEAAAASLEEDNGELPIFKSTPREGNHGHKIMTQAQQEGEFDGKIIKDIRARRGSFADQEIAAYKAGVLVGSDESTSVHQEIIRSLQMFAGLNSDQALDVMG